VKRSVLQIALILLCVSALGQDTDFSNRRSLSNFFNLGLSAGLGGDRIHYMVPTVSAKMGPFYGNYSTIFGSHFSYSFNIGADILEVGKKNANSQTCLTLSVGGSEFASLQNSDISYYNVSALFGVNRYLNNRNLSYSAKIGLMDKGKREFLGFAGGSRYSWNNYIYSYKYLPYAELTIGLNIFKHHENPATLIRPFVEGFVLSETKLEYAMPTMSGTIRKYFNPYISLGVGGDRIGAYPTIGFAMKRFYIDGISLKGISNYQQDWAMNLGYNFKSRDWQNSKFTPSVSIHRQCRSYTQRSSIEQDNYYVTKSGFKESVTDAVLAGVSIAPKRFSTLLRAQVGLGKIDEDKVVTIDKIEVEGETYSSTKIKPLIGLTLIIKMFKDVD
jgi:hypothetical protein